MDWKGMVGLSKMLQKFYCTFDRGHKFDCTNLTICLQISWHPHAHGLTKSHMASRPVLITFLPCFSNDYNSSTSFKNFKLSAVFISVKVTFISVKVTFPFGNWVNTFTLWIVVPEDLFIHDLCCQIEFWKDPWYVLWIENCQIHTCLRYLRIG